MNDFVLFRSAQFSFLAKCRRRSCFMRFIFGDSDLMCDVSRFQFNVSIERAEAKLNPEVCATILLTAVTFKGTTSETSGEHKRTHAEMRLAAVNNPFVDFVHNGHHVVLFAQICYHSKLFLKSKRTFFSQFSAFHKLNPQRQRK